MTLSRKHEQASHSRWTSIAAIFIAIALVAVGSSGSAVAESTAGVPEGTVLTASGSITVKKNGAVVDARDITGSISVKANNVTIKRTRVTNGGYHSIRIFDGFRGTVIEDVSITCTSTKGNGIVFGNYTARRVSITGCKNGFMSSANAPAVIEDSYWNGVPVGTTTAPTTTTVAPTTTTVAPTTTTTVAPTTTTVAPTTTTTVAPPVTSALPNATNTGVPAGVSLRPSGSLTISTPGAVVDALDISGTIEINADNVTIKRSRIRTNGARYGIRVNNGYRGAVIEDVEIAGTDTNCSVGIVYGNYTARRVNAHGCADGLRIGTNTAVEASYIHDQRKATGTHNDAIQSVGGSNVRIVGNNIVGPFQQSTSAVLLQTNNGPIDNVLMEGNRMSGGSYVLYVKDKGTGYGAPTNVTIRNNVWVWDSWLWGSHTVDKGAGFVWQNNTYEDGRPVA